jgi:hypothetical protein
MADGGYQGNRRIVCPTAATGGGGSELPAWQVELTDVHKRVHACVEHAFAQMKARNILRNCRHKRYGVHHATRGVALMRKTITCGGQRLQTKATAAYGARASRTLRDAFGS